MKVRVNGVTGLLLFSFFFFSPMQGRDVSHHLLELARYRWVSNHSIFHYDYSYAIQILEIEASPTLSFLQGERRTDNGSYLILLSPTVTGCFLLPRHNLGWCSLCVKAQMSGCWVTFHLTDQRHTTPSYGLTIDQEWAQVSRTSSQFWNLLYLPPKLSLPLRKHRGLYCMWTNYKSSIKLYISKLQT